MSHVVQKTLLPFQNGIIHNGIVVLYGICLSGNMEYMSNQIYFRAKETKSLHFSL